jgi:hypothetical protein
MAQTRLIRITWYRAVPLFAFLLVSLAAHDTELQESEEAEEAEVCLVLELVDGQTLHGPLPIETVLRCARQMPRLRKPRITRGIVQAFADKRLNSSAQPCTTTICLDVALSWSSSLIIRKRLPSAVTS